MTMMVINTFTIIIIICSLKWLRVAIKTTIIIIKKYSK